MRTRRWAMGWLVAALAAAGGPAVAQPAAGGTASGAAPGSAAPGAAAASPGPVPGRTYRVGYAQMVDHPALNATRAGFLDALRAAGFEPGRNLRFDYLNAQGDIANARNIAERFVADRVDLLAPCTTPLVQATLRVSRGTGLPVAFGCVSNPVQSGILATLDRPTGTNVTGTYGILPVPQMLDLVQQLRPAARRIGTIYNPAEANSAAQIETARAEAAKRGLSLLEVQVASSAEVRVAADSLAGRSDAWLMVQDNTVASAFDAVARVARDNRLPLFSLDTTAVERGAVAAYAQNQYKTGVDWANEVAIPILLGRDPGSILPVPYRAFDLYLNVAAAANSGITLPPELLAQAAEVHGR